AGPARAAGAQLPAADPAAGPAARPAVERGTPVPRQRDARAHLDRRGPAPAAAPVDAAGGAVRAGDRRLFAVAGAVGAAVFATDDRGRPAQPAGRGARGGAFRGTARRRRRG